MDKIKLRPAQLTDLPTLLTFEQGVVEAERPINPNIKTSGVKYYDIESLINSDNSQLIVAEQKHTLVACGYARIEAAKTYFKHDHHAYLGFMYVVPGFRGAGIIQLILDELISWSKAKNIREIILDVYEGNTSAIKAYENAGFSTYTRTMRLGLEPQVKSKPEH